MRAGLFWLNDRQWARIEPHLPTGLTGPDRDDDRRIVSGIIHMLQSGARWRDCPREYGPYTTVYNRFNRWAKRGRWCTIFEALAKPGKDAVALSLDSTSIKAHRCASGGKRGSTTKQLAAGTIASRAGVPADVDQWGWNCGFYPRSHDGLYVRGTAETFEHARADFEAAWREYLPKCAEADFEEYRRQRARTAWKYRMWDAGCRMPTQSTDGRSRCYCGATIDIAGVSQHVYAAHMAA